MISTLKISLLCLTAFFIFSPLFSQTTGKITGRILDADTQKPLPSASTVLVQASDSVRIGGSKSDKDGKFLIEARVGEYMLEVKYVGYRTELLKNIHISKDNMNVELADIILQPEAMQSEPITVEAEKEAVVYKGERKIFNITKDLVTAGGNATDVLKNIPSVNVDNDGNVTMRGAGVKVLIDGKESNLSSDMALQSIPSELVESVELITNPSAKYEADGITGIIDIKLKKERDDGFNGMVSLRGGSALDFSGRYNGGGSFDGNYKLGKWNIFGNGSASYFRGGNESSNYRKTWQELDTTLLSRDYTYDYRSLWANGKIGFDYNFTKKEWITFSINYNTGGSDNDNLENANIHDNNILTRKYNTSNNGKYNNSSISPSLNYKKDFAEQGHTLWVDMYYSYGTGKPESHSATTDMPVPPILLDTTELYQRRISDNGTARFIGKVDYEQPTKIGDLETGIRFQLNNSSDVYNYETLTDNIWTHDIGRSDDYDYNENISAAYFMLSNKLENFRYKLGVRAEYTDYKFMQNIMDSSYANDYLSWIPTLNLSYNIGIEHSFRLNYSRRISRPGKWNMNPHVSWSLDSTTASMGNPYLKPQYYNSYEADYMLFTPKTTASLNIYYRNTDEAIEYLYTTLPNGALLSQPENLAKNMVYGVDGNFMQKIAEWWRLNINLGYYKTTYEASQNNSRISNSWSGNMSMFFDITKQFSSQISAYYSSGNVTLQRTNADYYNLSLGCRYKMLDDKLSINISLSNLIYPDNSIDITRGDNFYSESRNNWQYRSFYLGISYKINNYQQKMRREERESAGQQQGQGGSTSSP